jgi:hypothetical protein
VKAIALVAIPFDKMLRLHYSLEKGVAEKKDIV